MKANVILRNGPASEVFEMADLPLPVLNDYDLLIKVFYTSVNPLDCRIRSVPSGKRAFPVTLGYDVCGEVVAMGKLAEGFETGDIIMGSPNPFRPGANAEFTAIDARTCIKTGNMDPVTAAAVPLAGITAWEALFDKLRITRGEKVLIHAGAGGVGHIAVQLAREHGCEVITTASRPESKDYCRTVLKADYVIDYKTESLSEVTNELTGGKGFRYILDAAGGNTFLESLSCLQSGGNICTILPVSFDAATGYANLLHNRTISYEFMAASLISGVHSFKQQMVLRELMKSIEKGALKVKVAGVETLENVSRVHETIEKGHTTGKWIIKVKE